MLNWSGVAAGFGAHNFVKEAITLSNSTTDDAPVRRDLL